MRIEKDYGTLEFAFNANNGKFVTNSLFLNDEDYIVDDVKYERSK